MSLAGPSRPHLLSDTPRRHTLQIPSSQAQHINAASSDSPAPVPAHWAPRVPVGPGSTPADAALPLPFQIPPPHHRRPPNGHPLRFAAQHPDQPPRRRARHRSDRPIRPAEGGHGLPQPRRRRGAGRAAGGRGGLVLVVRRRRGGDCGRGGAAAQEGPRRAEGARVHGQGAHQPHAALRRGEAELHLPRGHSVRAAPQSPATPSPSFLSVSPCYYLLRLEAYDVANLLCALRSNGSMLGSPVINPSVCLGLSCCFGDSGSTICS
jgi:hypothetical protein